MKFSKLAFLALVLLPLLSSAQKIKYKDLFPILNSGNYEEGEPQLKLFLSDSKNGDHANAHYQMGAILEKRFYDKDILGDTISISNAADSAVQMYTKAIELIDEKEIKKNDEYYNSFHRRDLRTGEFGIKLSDVHLDLEKKIEAINNRNQAIREFNTLLYRMKGRNNLSANIYKMIVDKADSRRNLLFQLGESDLVMLDRVRDNAQGLYTLANELKEAAKDLGTDYYQGFSNFKIIENYGADGLEQSDIFSGKLELWDYETWASSLKNDYYGVQEYKNIIETKEKEILTAQQMIEQGQSPESVSTEALMTDFEKYDSDGVAKPVLDLKASRLEVVKLGNPAINTALIDSTNVYAQLDAATKIIEELGSMDVVYSDISSPERISVASNRYPGILETYYGGTSGFGQFMDDLGAWLNEQKIVWAAKSTVLDSLDRWAVSETEKVPLFEGGKTGTYLTLGVTGDSLKIAFGLDAAKSESYIVWSGPSRGILEKKTFRVGGMSTETVKSQILPTPYFGYYVFDSSLTEKNLLLVATNGVGEVKWSNLVTATREPVSFRYDDMLDQLTVFYFPQDQLPEGDVTAYIAIDRNGVVR